MGECFIAVMPRCPVHGRLVCHDGTWLCAGFDGEGCDYEPELRWQKVTEISFRTAPPRTLAELEARAIAEGRPWPPPYPGDRR